MQDFESYIKSNWSVPNATACGITYTHTSKQSIDKKSKRALQNHSINMKIVWLDKDNSQLKTERLTFTNDTLSKIYEKRLLTINASEATNKFRAAKQEILLKLIRANQEKIDSIQEEIDSMRQYYGNSTDIIQPSMKSYIEIVDNQHAQEQVQTTKQTFDM